MTDPGKTRPRWGPFNWLRRRLRGMLFNAVRHILETDDGRAMVVEVLRNQFAGRLLSEVRLDGSGAPEDSEWGAYAWLGGDRYVVTRSEPGIDGRAFAWWVDAAARRVEPVVGFDCPAIEFTVARTLESVMF